MLPHAVAGLVLVGAFLSGCTTPAFTDDLFEQHEVVTGTAERQTVLTGSLLGDAVAELAVVEIDENDDRRLRIYALDDGAWVPKLDATLRPEVLFVDVANIGGRDRLVTYQPGRLNWFDPESAAERLLVAVTTNYSPPRTGEVPHVDVTRDVNGDDRDDLVVPDVDGFRVFIQMIDGAFADPVQLGPAPRRAMTAEHDGYRYDPWDQGRVHEMDYNRDGRRDLVFWNEDHFEVHDQNEYGLFGPAPRTFTTDVAFDSDELGSLAAPQEARHRRMDHGLAGDMTGRVLYSLTDVNGDGIADLGVFSLKGGSRNTVFGDTGALWNMQSTYQVYFGTPTPDGGTVFAPDAGAVIASDGIPFGMEQHDFDHDGQADMMFITFDPDIFKAIGAYLSRSITLDVEFSRMEGGIYADKPSTTRRTRSDSLGKSGERAALFPSVMIGDVNGDRRSDLLVGRSGKELRVYLGVPGPGLFARQPQCVAVAMPDYEEYTWLADLNRDGKQDVLMHHSSTTEPHRVTTLIAR
jgi:hypothetical protein